MRKSLVFAAMWFGALTACSQPQAPVQSVASQTPEQQANATASSAALTGDGTVLQLAIPVEISSSGVRVVGEGEVIRAPRPQPGAGPQLVVTLEGDSGAERFLRKYEVPDPRLSEIEGQGQRIFPAAQTFVYVELADPATRLDIRPSSDGPAETNVMMEFGVEANSSIVLAPIASKVCESAHQSTALCQQARAQ